MNSRETNRLLACITAVYPGFIKDRDPKIIADIWQRIFMQESYELVEAALSAFIASDTKGFPPTPGAVNAYILKLRQLNELSEDEAWTLIRRAACNSSYHAAEEFEKLPPELRRYVGSAQQLNEWAMMDTHTFETVTAAGFRRSWRTRHELERELVPFLPEAEKQLFLEGPVPEEGNVNQAHGSQ